MSVHYSGEMLMNQAKYRTKALSLFPAMAVLLMTAGAGYALAETAAPASSFDTEAARRALNAGGTSAAILPAPPEVKNPPANPALAKALRNTAPAVLPEGCSLVSYTRDGVFAAFRCPEHDIMSIVMEPKNDITAAAVINDLTASGNCTASEYENYIYGARLSCRGEPEEYDNYVGQGLAGFITILTTDTSYNDSVVLSSLQNLALTIYFFQRHIAKDNEQIKYLNKMLEDAAPARDAAEMNEIRMKSRNK